MLVRGFCFYFHQLDTDWSHLGEEFSTEKMWASLRNTSLINDSCGRAQSSVGGATSGQVVLACMKRL